MSDHGAKVEKLLTSNMYQFWDLELVHRQAGVVGEENDRRKSLLFGHQRRKIVIADGEDPGGTEDHLQLPFSVLTVFSRVSCGARS